MTRRPSTDPAAPPRWRGGWALHRAGPPARALLITPLILAPLFVAMLVGLSACDTPGESFNLYKKGRNQWDAGEFYDSARTYLTLTELYPGSPLVENSLYWAATLYQYFLNDSDLAERHYRQLLVQFPDGERNHDAMENLAGVYEQNKATRYKAILLYKKLHEAEQGRQDYFQFKIAQVYLDSGKADQARFEMHNLIKNYPESPLLPEAYYLIGYSYYREERMPLAVVAFNQIAKDYPDHPMGARGRFFVADILEEEGLMKKALKTYESLRGKYHNPAILEKRITALKSRMGRSVR